MASLRYWALVFAAVVMVMVAVPFIFVYYQARGIFFACVNTWRYVSGFIGQVKHDLRYHWSGYDNTQQGPADGGAKPDQEGDAIHGRADTRGDRE